MTVLLIGFVVACVIGVIVDYIRKNDFAGLVAAFGVATGLAICHATLYGSLSALPDLGPVPHGTGYLLGLGVVAVGCLIGIVGGPR